MEYKWTQLDDWFFAENLEGEREWAGNWIVLKLEGQRDGAVGAVSLVVLNGAHEEWTVVERQGEQNSKDDSGECSSDESFPRLLRRQLDQRRLSPEESEHVGHDIAADDHGDGSQEPNEALEDVLDDEEGLTDDEKEGQMGPGKQ